MYEQVLNEVTPKYENKIQMYKVNIEDEPQLAQKFGAKSIPFTVMISTTGERESQAGVINKDTLQYLLDGLISK